MVAQQMLESYGRIVGESDCFLAPRLRPMIHLHPMTRRHVLCSAGALVSLPFLESFGFRRHAAATPPAPRPKRLVFLGFGWGVTDQTWFPSRDRTGTGYILPEGLAPLARHQRDITVVQGCMHKFSREGHSGSTFWLTGANQFAVPGQSFSNTISADQLAAATLGTDTRFPSIQLGCNNPSASGHGAGTSMAWDAHGRSLSSLDSPRQVYERLFFADNTPPAARRAAIAHERSVLDLVLEDARAVSSRLSRHDVEKLDEYFESVRDIERRLAKDEQWIDVSRPAPPCEPPPPELDGRREIEAMYALLVAALQTDSTRVITYRQPAEQLIRSLGIKHTGHDLSHYGPGAREEGSRRRDVVQSELLAGLLDRLKAVQEPDGTRLFDHVALAYGSNIRMHHNLDNCPTVIAGGGAGVALGRHVVLPDRTPLCSVWLTLLAGIGVAAPQLGDSDKTIPELMG